MKDDDLVDLVFVTQNNFVFAHNVQRKEASETIAGWYRLMQYQGAYSTTHGGYSTMAISWESVIGMYVREKSVDAISLLASAQEKIAQAYIREANQGDEWRGE